MKPESIKASDFKAGCLALLDEVAESHAGPTAQWSRDVLTEGDLELTSLGERIAVLAAEISPFHGDPVDRILVAHRSARPDIFDFSPVRCVVLHGICLLAAQHQKPWTIQRHILDYGRRQFASRHSAATGTHDELEEGMGDDRVNRALDGATATLATQRLGAPPACAVVDRASLASDPSRRHRVGHARGDGFPGAVVVALW